MKKHRTYVLTGGPSSGKTTVLHELKKRGYKIVKESSRYYIENELKKGLSLEEIRRDKKKFQENIFQYMHDWQSKLDDNVVTFLDRGYHDAVAYLQHYGEEVSDFITEHAQPNLYTKVFALDMLPYEADDVRDEDEVTANELHEQLRKTYKEYGHEVIDVPVLPPAERAQFILNHIEQD